MLVCDSELLSRVSPLVSGMHISGRTAASKRKNNFPTGRNLRIELEVHGGWQCDQAMEESVFGLWP